MRDEIPPACEAKVAPDAWTIVRCGARARYERQGHDVCGNHKRQYDRWLKDGRDARNMAWYLWEWHDAVEAS